MEIRARFLCGVVLVIVVGKRSLAIELGESGRVPRPSPPLLLFEDVELVSIISSAVTIRGKLLLIPFRGVDNARVGLPAVLILLLLVLLLAAFLALVLLIVAPDDCDGRS